jgi:carbamoyl-phosphate synthase large subunit
MEGICDSSYLIPYPSCGSRALLERIQEIHNETPLDAIVPTLDSELPSFLAIKNCLSEMGIGIILPTAESLLLCSKAMLPKLKDMGINVPLGKCLSDLVSIDVHDKSLNYPMVIKGKFYEADIVYSQAQAHRSFKRLAAKWGVPVIAQEFIVGEEYDIVAVGDGLGGLIGAVPMRKMQLTDKGKAWGGLTICDPELDSFVKEMMSILKWNGPCEFEVMKSTKDEYYLIEVNPRFPAWCFLAVEAGQNLPWVVAKMALGQKVSPLPQYKVGIMFLRHCIDVAYPMEIFESMTTKGEYHKEKEVS